MTRKPDNELNKVKSEEYSRVIELIKEIGAEERHFNNLSNNYKTLASTWLLSTFAGIGFILTQNIEPKSLFIGGIGFAGGVGILLLWLIDLRVYQQLLAANFIEGLLLEERHKWLPPIRQNMVETQLTGTVIFNLAWFYILGISIPILIGSFSFLIYLKTTNLVLIILGIMGLTIFIIILLNTVVRKIDEESLKKRYANKNIIFNKIIRNLHFVIGLFFLASSTIYILFNQLKSYETEYKFRSTNLSSNYDYLAPNNSEIRLLSSLNSGSMAHCVLPVDETSFAVKHKSVKEIWYVVEGEGSLWRKNTKYESVIQLNEGTSLTIPPQTSFQFKNNGSTPLKIIIVTIPPWPGKQEAQNVEGYWD